VAAEAVLEQAVEPQVALVVHLLVVVQQVQVETVGLQTEVALATVAQLHPLTPLLHQNQLHNEAVTL
jgi:hypothetical protein